MFSPSLIPLYTCVCQGTGSFYSHRTSKEDHVLLPVQVYKAPTYTATHQHRSYFYSRSGKGTCPFQIKKYSHFCSLQPTPRSTEEISLHNPKPPTKATYCHPPTLSLYPDRCEATPSKVQRQNDNNPIILSILLTRIVFPQQDSSHLERVHSNPGRSRLSKSYNRSSRQPFS